MKVDRRSFLGLGLGAVAGVAISPVGVKLTDDSSIWTQNWPWTPVPEDGQISYDASVCSLCPGSCGISVRKIDNRPVKIEGLDGYPVNDGGACLHGIAGLQYLYDPARVKHPLRKTGNGFEPVSWDDAISMVAEKLGEVRGKAPEKLGCICDKDAGSVSGLFKHFLTAFGSPNFYAMPGLDAYLELTAATFHGQGNTLGFDLENSEFVLSFGAGIIEGWGSPVHCFKANASRKERHAKLFQIEPRLSNTAAGADQWIPVNPGTEGDLALSMCAVLIQEKKFDSGFTSTFKGGFNKFVAALETDYAPEKMAEVTGVSADDIRKTALMFADAKTAVAVPGKGRGAGAQSLKEFAAVYALNLLKGNINQKGGVFVLPKETYLSFPDPVMDETAEAGAGKDKAAVSVNALVQALGQDGDPALEALLVYNANPCYTLNQPEAVKKAFEKIPFVVAFSSFLDETAMAADIVLPMSTFLEKTEDVAPGGALPARTVGLTRTMVDPVFDTKAPGDALISLASAIGDSVAESFAWESYGECLEALTADIWEALSEDGYASVSQDLPSGVPNVDFSFLSQNPASVQPEGEGKLLLIPIDNMRLTQAVPAASPFAVKTVSDKVLSGKDILVEVNPQTAGGLADGSFAMLETPAGSARVRVNLNHGIMPGVIGMVRGLGHTFDNKFVSNKGVNVNNLIGPVIEAGSGLDAAFGIRANLSKA